MVAAAGVDAAMAGLGLRVVRKGRERSLGLRRLRRRNLLRDDRRCGNDERECRAKDMDRLHDNFPLGFAPFPEFASTIDRTCRAGHPTSDWLNRSVARFAANVCAAQLAGV